VYNKKKKREVTLGQKRAKRNACVIYPEREREDIPVEKEEGRMEHIDRYYYQTPFAYTYLGDGEVLFGCWLSCRRYSSSRPSSL
jgi:hypothetical protein